jgi:hypothetical protein
VNQLVPISSPVVSALVAAAGERASMRFLEFFAANIRNTRRAYAGKEFLSWRAEAGVPSIAATEGRSKRRRRLLTTPQRARRSCMIAATMRLASMRSKGS